MVACEGPVRGPQFCDRAIEVRGQDKNLCFYVSVFCALGGDVSNSEVFGSELKLKQRHGSVIVVEMFDEKLHSGGNNEVLKDEVMEMFGDGLHGSFNNEVLDMDSQQQQFFGGWEAVVKVFFGKADEQVQVLYVGWIFCETIFRKSCDNIIVRKSHEDILYREGRTTLTAANGKVNCERVVNRQKINSEEVKPRAECQNHTVEQKL